MRQRRRGPSTDAGKARVRGNAITHGIASVTPVIPGETTADWETHRNAIVKDIAPADAVETALADRVALGLWRLRRVTNYETAALTERQSAERASARLLPHPDDLDKILRYEAHLTRGIYQALHELEARRTVRQGHAAPLARLDVHGLTDAVNAVADA